MPGVSRRAGEGGRYRIWYTDERGKRKFATGTADKRRSLELANDLELQARRVREGLVDPREKQQRAAAGVEMSHLVGLWEASIVARGKSAKHARHQAGDARRVLAAAGVSAASDLDTDRVAAAVAALTVPGKSGPAPASARTRNHALAAVKAFARWLDASGRIREYPRPWRVKGGGDKANEAADRRRVRRALTPGEFSRLLAATEAGPDVEARRGRRDRMRRAGALAFLSGPDRAMLYRVAAGTGFRANELRSLTPRSFDLDAVAGDGSPDPAVVVEAAYSKNGRRDRQPIRRDLADLLRPWLAGRDPDSPCWPVPEKTARMIRADMGRAGIPAEDGGKVADFHALRAAYITGLVRSGVDPSTAQKLARHSDVRLTLSTYVDTGKRELRKALEGGE